MSKRRFRDEGSGFKESKDTNPPMSRLFLVISKNTTEEELKQEFDQYGEITEIWLLKNRSTNESKGKRLFLIH